MFLVGDRVLYGIHGVCSVTDMETKTVDKQQVQYLVLEPLDRDGSRYLVPTHNKTAMGKLKKILTKQELETLLDSEVIRKDCWIADEGTRKQTYRELITRVDREKLMAMIRSLYLHKERQQAAGRKVHLCDENFLADAEKLLAGEVAVVMEIDRETAKKKLRAWLHK